MSVDCKGDTIDRKEKYVDFVMVAIGGVVDPSTQDYAYAVWTLLEAFVELVFANDLDDALGRVRGKKLRVKTHHFQ